MRSFITKAALTAAFIATSLVGAQAATRMPVKHPQPNAERIIAEADAAFQHMSLDRYNRDLSSDNYKWLKTEANSIKADAQRDSRHGVLSGSTYAQLQQRINSLNAEIERDRAPA